MIVRRALLAALLVTGPLHGAERPNFIVFLTDDLGWGDLACYGHERIQTPNLDKFASEGVLFLSLIQI